MAIGLISVSEAGTVNNAFDSGQGSLREVLAAAVDSEVIDFTPALDGATITLSTGALPISGRTLSIDASALSSGITISGNNSSRIFTISASANVTLMNLHLVSGRETGANGGGIYALQSTLVMENCSIQSCFSSSDGGGLWGNNITGSIARCSIAGNESSSFGGGLYLIGGSSLSISSTRISGNKSLVGGGVFTLFTSPSFINCTIQGNSGSGMRNDQGTAPILRNCIVWGNAASGGTLAAMQLSNSGSAPSPSSPDVASCLIEGASSSASFSDGNRVVWGGGNLDGTLPANAPSFVASLAAALAPTAAADLRLNSGSAAIDAGSNGANTVDSLDLAEKPRIQNGVIDLGAFEGPYVQFATMHPGLDPDADANLNGLSNFQEYAMGLDPAAASGLSGLPTITRTEGVSFVTFVQRHNATDLEVTWQTSTDLMTWPSMIEGVDYQINTLNYLSTAQAQFTIELLGADPKRFYRQRFSSAD